MRILELSAGQSCLIVSSPVHKTIPIKNSAKTRKTMDSLQTLLKRGRKIESLRIFRKEEHFSRALCTPANLACTDPKLTNRYRPRNEVERSVSASFHQFCPITEVEYGPQHFNSCVVDILTHGDVYAPKSPTVFQPWGFPTNLGRNWIYF